MEKITQLYNTTPEQLTETIFKGLDHRLEDLKRNFQPQREEEFLTAKELEKTLKISATTRWQWSKKGILKPYKIGNRTYYSRKEITEQLFNSNK